MKTYLDNDVVSAIVKEDFPAHDILVLRQLMVFFDEGKVDLRTSKLILREIERYKGPKKTEMQEVYRRLNKVPFVEDPELLGFHSQWSHQGGVTWPLMEDDPTSSKVRQMGLERTDAHHLMLAIRAECDVFLTSDRKILNRSAQIKSQFSVRAMKPSAFVAELEGSGEGD